MHVGHVMCPLSTTLCCVFHVLYRIPQVVGVEWRMTSPFWTRAKSNHLWRNFCWRIQWRKVGSASGMCSYVCGGDGSGVCLRKEGGGGGEES